MRISFHKIFLMSLIPTLTFFILTLLFSLNVTADTWIKINTSPNGTVCVRFNTTYNETVDVPSTLCGFITCADDPSCCNPKVTDSGGQSYSLAKLLHTGKLFVDERCALKPGIYYYNITGFDFATNPVSAGKMFEIVQVLPPNCGDGNRTGNEECDDGNNVNGDGCNEFCELEKCGDEVANNGEECDTDDLNGMDCNQLGFPGGNLKCSATCYFDTSGCNKPVEYCGDGKVQAGEQCDGGVGSVRCSDISSSFTGGTLTCNPPTSTAKCHYNTSKCVGPEGGYCGDGDVVEGEQCDGGVGSMTCHDVNSVFTGGILTCNPPTSTAKCLFNTSQCTTPQPYCGDGVRQLTNNEVCDKTDWGNITGCDDFDAFVGGTLRCYESTEVQPCHFDTTDCDPYQKPCGNGKVDPGEECDSNDLNGQTCESLDFLRGTLKCRNNCLFDTTSCTPKVEYCGNGRVDVGEQCDGSTGGKKCQDISSEFTGGTLTCNSRTSSLKCYYNTSNCVGLEGGYCGDGDIVEGEQCEGGVGSMNCSLISSVFTGGTLRCIDCMYDTNGCSKAPPVPFCGDGVKNQVSEECDGTDLGSETCKSLGYASGNLQCVGCNFDKSHCVPGTGSYCGDNLIQTPNSVGLNEQCDGSNLGNARCSNIDSYTGGALACYDDCSFDYSACTGAPPPKCGDGAKNQVGEDCDGTDFGGETCKSLGYASGNLKCTTGTSGCKFDKSGCVPGTGTYCGDGVIQKPNSAGLEEKCDSSNLNKNECDDFDEYTGGKLKCSGICAFDYTNCTKEIDKGYCGDGIKNNNEICDKNDWGNITGCADFSAFRTGSLVCSATNCHFDTSGCIPGNITPVPNGSCANNKKDGSETDIDCGGTLCNACINGKACLINLDCQSNYCKNSVCSEATCTDTVKNGIETGIDCGGSCPPCPDGTNCSIDSDCISTFCNPITHKCTVPTCTDGFLNGDETGKDCGDGCPVKCALGQPCRTSTDCETGYCELGVCSADRNKDSDGDGMPDWWEDQYNLDPNDDSDADEDADGDGYTNLEEYNMNTDPTDASDPGKAKKKHTFQIILLIMGGLLIVGSVGFLIYSRKVLIPEQKAAAQKRAIPQPMLQRPMLRPMAGRPQAGLPGRGFPGRLAQKQGERRALLEGFGKEGKPGAKEEGAAKPAKEAAKEGRKPDEFIHIDELGKKAEKPAEKEGKPIKKPVSDAFKKLKELSTSYKKKEK